MTMPKLNNVSGHIVLTSHPSNFSPKPIAIKWGSADPMTRSPIVATLTKHHRNVIGIHSGGYGVYTLAVASGALESNHRADLTNTSPIEHISPHPS
jgi:hypothetical protein